MEDKIFTKEDADDFLEICGQDMMEKEDDIWYLASVQKSPGSEEYRIEKGYLQKGDAAGKFVLTKDTIKYCPQDGSINKSIDYLRNKVGSWQSTKKEVPSKNEAVGMIEHQSISELRIRPLIAGITCNATTTPEKTGTIGAFLRLSRTTQSNEVYFITNHHNIAEADDIADNTLVFQPHNDYQDYNNLIGTVVKGCYHNSFLTYPFDVDFALVKINITRMRPNFSSSKENGVLSFHPKCQVAGFIDNAEKMIKKPQLMGIEEPQIGMDVYFHGTTTVKSKTTQIRSINALVKVKDPYKKYGSRLFRKQLLFNNISRPGDSGAVIINCNKKIVGLLHAADKNNKISVANNINHILYEGAFNRNDQRIGIQSILT